MPAAGSAVELPPSPGLPPILPSSRSLRGEEAPQGHGSSEDASGGASGEGKAAGGEEGADSSAGLRDAPSTWTHLDGFVTGGGSGGGSRGGGGGDGGGGGSGRPAAHSQRRVNALERLTDLQAKQSGLLHRAASAANAVARRRGVALKGAEGSGEQQLAQDLLAALLSESRS